MWLSKLVLSGIGYLQRYSRHYLSNSREFVRVSNETPEVGITIFLVGNPGQRIPLIHRPYTLTPHTSRCWVCRRIPFFVLDLLERDVQRGTYWCTIRQKQGKTLSYAGNHRFKCPRRAPLEDYNRGAPFLTLMI